MIAVIDYGTGNLQSVVNAFRYLGEKVEVCAAGKDLSRAEKIVLPGVGSSHAAMEELIARGFIEPLLAHLKGGTPFLGICLGLQLLFTESPEGPGCACLNVVSGEVKLFPGGPAMKVPQIGWNTVAVQKNDCPLFKDIKDNSYFYFVHSYYCETKDPGLAAGVTEYGARYVSALWKDNIFAVQFHPERSQENGLKLLKNFAAL
ncbi:MAG: imidazole glycerol phosphate synthase subunit HisH [Candidatus Omnitrophota bacterium]